MGWLESGLLAGETAKELSRGAVYRLRVESAQCQWERSSQVPDWALVLVGGLTGVLLTQKLSDWSERRIMRRDVLRKLAGHRYQLTGEFMKRSMDSDGEVWVALNEICIAYVDNKPVMKELRKFKKRVDDCKFGSSDLVPLIRAMAKAAKLPGDSVDGHQIEHPFVRGTKAAESRHPKGTTPESPSKGMT